MSRLGCDSVAHSRAGKERGHALEPIWVECVIGRESRESSPRSQPVHRDETTRRPVGLRGDRRFRRCRAFLEYRARAEPQYRAHVEAGRSGPPAYYRRLDDDRLVVHVSIGEEREEAEFNFVRTVVEKESPNRSPYAGMEMRQLEALSAEQDLNRLFAQREISREVLESATREIARLAGELRAVHFQAHLEMAEILSAEQRHAYAAYRGYDRDSMPSGHHPGRHHLQAN